MDITEAYERYKSAVSDLDEAMATMHISSEGLPAESIQSVMKNFQTRHEILISVSEKIRGSLRSITNRVRKLKSEISEATGSMVFMAMAADNHQMQQMQPDAGVSGGADVTGECNMAAPPLIGSILNKAPSEDADQEDNLAEPEEREENNMAESKESTADPRMSAMHIE